MLNNKARSFVVIMIAIALGALLLRLVIHRAIKFTVEQNQLYAQGNLKLLSTALENYAKDNKGVYPQSFSLLMQGQPAYLGKNYIVDSPLRGYEYDCARLDPTGYNCQASPTSCRLTGSTIYSVSTGGLIISESCDKK